LHDISIACSSIIDQGDSVGSVQVFIQIKRL
jgi:hypothetical protein